MTGELTGESTGEPSADRDGDATRRSEVVIGLALTLGAGVVIVGAFGTWVRSGARGRSSFEVFELIDRLGFDPDGLYGWMLRAWPLLPLALVAGVVAWWFRRRRLAIALTATAGIYALVVSGGILRAPDTSLVSVGAGPKVAVVGAAILLAATAAAVLTPWVGRRRRTTDLVFAAPRAAPPGDRS